MTRINRRVAIGALTGMPVVITTVAEAQESPIRIQTPYANTIGVAAAALTNGPNGQGANSLGVLVRAICPGATIYWGNNSSVTVDTGMPLYDGDSLNLEVRNASEIWMVASAAGQSLRIAPYR